MTKFLSNGRHIKKNTLGYNLAGNAMSAGVFRLSDFVIAYAALGAFAAGEMRV